MKKSFAALKTPIGMFAIAVLVPVFIVLLLVGALSGIRHAYQANRIVSTSMAPTLNVGDRILIDKLTYQKSDPERGDIVLYYPPAIYVPRKPDTLPQKLGKITGLACFPAPIVFIHRIVGIPGDKVEVRKGDKVLVNGDVAAYQHMESPFYEAKKMKDLGGQYGKQVVFPDDERDIVVPADSYFVLGDNINNAADSHVFGFVARQDIVGKLGSIITKESEASMVPENDPRVAE